jgi:hypothetical protein
MSKSVRGVLKLVPAVAFAAASPASAQLFLYDPVFPSAPIEATDPIVGIALPNATAAESRAHLVWNLRSGLNVAALQCQFSPSLRAVENYNALLAHHSKELAAAYQTLEGYFRRVHGRTGPRMFDEYSTQTYNNFSTLQAQIGFCQTAARIAREALARRKGELHQVATARMRELRGSLVAAYETYAFTRMPIRLTPPVLVRNCANLPRRERRACERP